MNLKLFGEFFVTLLVIVDPPGMVPVFLALTGSLPAKARNRAGTQAVLLALGVIVGFAVVSARTSHTARPTSRRASITPSSTSPT